MTTIAIWLMLFGNAGISLLFAHAVGTRHEPWGWPPSWVRVVTLWLTSKTFWLVPLAFFWQQGWIRFDVDAPSWAKTVYVILLASFTIFHGLAAFYYITGRAALPPIQTLWDGKTERRFQTRRAADRKDETPIEQLIREREQTP